MAAKLMTIAARCSPGQSVTLAMKPSRTARTFLDNLGNQVCLEEFDISWIEDNRDGTTTVQTKNGRKHVLQGSTVSVYEKFGTEPDQPAP